MSKVAKSKGKTRGKNGKTGKCVERRDNESPYSFQKSQFEVIVKDFVSRLVLAYRRGNLILNIMYGKFWFDGDFFVRNLDPSVELRQYQSLLQRNFFFS